MPTSESRNKNGGHSRGRRVGEPLYTLLRPSQGPWQPGLVHSALDGADEIPFPDFDATLAQDCVGRGAVEIKVRHGEMLEILRTGQFQRIAADREHDFASFAAVDLLGLEALDVAEHRGDAGTELAEGLLGVLGCLGNLHAGKPGRAL